MYRRGEKRGVRGVVRSLSDVCLCFTFGVPDAMRPSAAIKHFCYLKEREREGSTCDATLLNSGDGDDSQKTVCFSW